jgi:hypothetical protein
MVTVVPEIVQSPPLTVMTAFVLAFVVAITTKLDW